MKKVLFVFFIFIIINSFAYSKATGKNVKNNLVVINKNENSVVIGYSVTLENTVITYKGLKIFIHGRLKKSRANLSNLIHALTKVGADAKDLISILSILHRAGTLSGKLLIM